MDKNIDNKNKDFLEILKHKKDNNFKIEHKVVTLSPGGQGEGEGGEQKTMLSDWAS